LAYIIWQISLTAAKNLHAQNFDYGSDEQRIAVITEYLAFLVHVADRLTHNDMNDKARAYFISTVARAVARHLQENKTIVMGAGEHGAAFVNMLNERTAEYAQTSFPDDSPGYEFQRCFGEKILCIMGPGQVNRWVIDQVMDIDAPEAVAQLKQAMGNLFGSAQIELPERFDPE
jgi:FlaA1/EpsC-like NDP-sugar epimerase